MELHAGTNAEPSKEIWSRNKSIEIKNINLLDSEKKSDFSKDIFISDQGILQNSQNAVKDRNKTFKHHSDVSHIIIDSEEAIAHADMITTVDDSSSFKDGNKTTKENIPKSSNKENIPKSSNEENIPKSSKTSILSDIIITLKLLLFRTGTYLVFGCITFTFESIFLHRKSQLMGIQLVY